QGDDISDRFSDNKRVRKDASMIACLRNVLGNKLSVSSRNCQLDSFKIDRIPEYDKMTKIENKLEDSKKVRTERDKRLIESDLSWKEWAENSFLMVDIHVNVNGLNSLRYLLARMMKGHSSGIRNQHSHKSADMDCDDEGLNELEYESRKVQNLELENGFPNNECQRRFLQKLL
ncbi:16307_t:CDS:2, partial [Dentiscutata heterogama]